MSDNVDALPVNSRASFVAFLALLQQDLVCNPIRWENKTLADFLAAMHSYAEDIQGYYDNTDQSINANEAHWQVFADIMRGARVYE
ncbi:hypothetical protein GCM10023172_13460 [Hymenobacter ginsengisoli]|uniref:DUF7660 domain-containing protein n=1 Tax=Hymenobacter ginsengisoli TaxID=1051626 RepID=A0ABP8Q816_9BACT|nr:MULTISPECIES: hypothetical protein [unclassified Hymenobacter]MBO2033587.1 hypothetical protein [Hymenobacter sp. BT559]